jgi:glutamate synthase (NADPH/NADH) small chain
MTTKLPEARAERALPDKKPLFTYHEARAEADRCLFCADAPCIKACPTEIDIPTFIKKIATGNVRGSARTIFEQNILGYSCARVCPTEVLCEGSCVYNSWQKAPIKIGRLQRYATQEFITRHGSSAGPAAGPGAGTPGHATDNGAKPIFVAGPPSGKKVALVGAGPASLSCAAYLAILGHKGVIFDKRAYPGGLNTTGIAPYKMQADDSIHEVEWVQALGVEIRTGVEIGKDVTGKKLLDEYDAVFIGVGLGDDSRLGIPGEDGRQVMGATAWIEWLKTEPQNAGAQALLKHARVIVVGGGNTAIDVARECAQLGAASVSMVYRRGKSEMSGYDHEMMSARKEGVVLVEHALPSAFVRDAHGKLLALRVVDAKDGRPVPGTPRDLPCDFVAVAIGQSKLLAVAEQFPGVALDARGCIVADAKTGRTGNPKVFSGGDCVNGGKEVVNAVADGRNAARFLDAQWKSHG